MADERPMIVRNDTADANIVYQAMYGMDYAPDLVPYDTVRRVVDIGAHIGGFCRFVKQHAPAAQIVAVEPDMANAGYWIANMQDQPHAMLIIARVAYTWLDVRRVWSAVNTGGVSFVPVETPIDEAFEVDMQHAPGNDTPTVTLEQVVGDVLDWDVLKIDCEGAEFDVLLNAPLDTLRRFHWIVGEIHLRSGDIQNIWQRLAPFFTSRRAELISADLAVICWERQA